MDVVRHDDKAVEIVSHPIEVHECGENDFTDGGEFQMALPKSAIQPCLDLVGELLAVGDVGFVAPWLGVIDEKFLPFLLSLPEFCEWQGIGQAPCEEDLDIALLPVREIVDSAGDGGFGIEVVKHTGEPCLWPAYCLGWGKKPATGAALQYQ